MAIRDPGIVSEIKDGLFVNECIFCLDPNDVFNISVRVSRTLVTHI